MEHYVIGDKIFFYVYYFDDDGYDKYKEISGVIIEKINGYGFNVKASAYVCCDEVHDILSQELSVKNDNKLISVSYSEVIDHVSKANVNKLSTFDALKNKWERLVFRYVDVCEGVITKTYKKGNMGDAYSDISVDYLNIYNFSVHHCWFHNDIIVLDKPMIVGIVDHDSFKTWSFCDERLYQLWWIICKTNGKEYYNKSRFSKIIDDYKIIADYVINEKRDTKENFEESFKSKILWFK